MTSPRLELHPPHDLVISWRAASVTGSVTWRLSAAGDGETLLVMTHDGLPDDTGVRRDYDIGWWDFLVEMKREIELPAGGRRR